ncbi:MAG: PQQ-dependent sugar dehydrogenase [Solirubrobacterales bacterium]
MFRAAGRSLWGALAALIASAALWAGGASAGTVPLTLHQLLPSHVLVEPTDLASDPAHPNRLYVTDRAGHIYTVEDGHASLLADLSALVRDRTGAGEEAMESIALAPDFAQSGHLYVTYSGTDGYEYLAELTASGGTAPLSTLRQVLKIAHPNNFHHWMGRAVFGPDGYLYVSTGDGYTIDTPPYSIPGVQAMYLNDLRGKILRIDPEDPDGAGPASYSVPSDNPYVSDGDPGTLPEIWSYGFRNPYRISFDRLTGDLVIGDVGDDTNEEIDFAKSPGAGKVGGKGLFYGWPCREGFDPSVAAGNAYCLGIPAYTDPVFSYPHPEPPDGSGCSAIVTGFVVRDANLGDLFGRLLYGDYCGGKVRSLKLSNPAGSDRAEPDLGPRDYYDLNSFGEDSSGRVYEILATEGTILRIEPSSQFRFTGAKLDRRRGTAVLSARVGAAGVLALKGSGLRNATTRASRGGTWGVAVRPYGSLKRRLASSGSATVSARVTFTAKGGTPVTKTKKLALKQNPGR